MAETDPQKKYWWLILVVLPIVLALIGLTPNFLKKDDKKKIAETIAPVGTQKTRDVNQSTEKGHNFNNVKGNITIIEDEKKP